MKLNILTGTFFWVATTAVSTPFSATDVSPPWLMALNAYSEKEKRNISQIAHNTIFLCNTNRDCLVIVLTSESWNMSNTKSETQTRFNRNSTIYKKNIHHKNSPTWYSLPSGENIVICLSNPALLPRAMIGHVNWCKRNCKSRITLPQLSTRGSKPRHKIGQRTQIHP